MSRMRQKRKARARAAEEAAGHAQPEAEGVEAVGVEEGGEEPVIEVDPEEGDDEALAPDSAEDADAGIDHPHEEEPGEGEVDAGEADPDADLEPVRGISPERLKLVVESLLFASDKPLSVTQLRHLTGERNLASIQAALDALVTDYAERGVVLGELAGGYQFRTNPSSAEYVQRLIAGRPVRLSRAQLETLAIIAYRQPVTRPEIDEIRGVDCGGTLKLLLDRSLIRVLGKKEEPGRPLLYGTSKEFLEFFNLKDLRDLPTLREFHELSEESMREVEKLDAESGEPEAGSGEGGTGEAGSDDDGGAGGGEEPENATGAAAAAAE
jgi:segregation and condensation protein B